MAEHKTHLLNVSYDASKLKSMRAVINMFESHLPVKMAGGGHYKGRADVDFWCDEDLGNQIIQLLKLYFDVDSCDMRFHLHPVKEDYVSPFTGEVV